MESVDNRRVAPRHPCAGEAEILQNGKRTGWGKVIDISSSGCYVETAHPIAAEEQVQLRLTISGVELEIDARVVWLTPLVGMGMAFVINSPDDEARITDILGAVNGVYKTPVVQAADDPRVGGAAIHLTKEAADKILPKIIQHINKRGSMTRQELIALIKAVQ